MHLRHLVSQRRNELILLSVLILGMSLRLHCLDCESLWLDEGFSVEWARSGPLNIIYSSASDVQSPLYYILLHCWVFLAGDSETILRFLSAIFGIASILLIYRIGQMLFDIRTGLVTALLFALSTFQIYFSQEARAYSMLVFLSMLSMYFFLSLPRGRRMEAGYLISTSLMLYTHIYGLFLVAAQNACFFLMERRPAGTRKWASLQSITIISFLPWAGVTAFQLYSMLGPGNIAGWIPVPSLFSLASTLFEYSGYYFLMPEGFGTTQFMILTSFSLMLSAIVLAFIFKQTVSFRNGRMSIPRKDRRQNVILLTWLSVPLLVPFVISLLIVPIYWARYTIVASPAFYMLASRGISTMKNKRAIIIVLAIIVSLSLLDDARYHAEVNKEQWREASQFIEERAGPGDPILFYRGFARYGPVTYYLNRSDSMMIPVQGTGPDEILSHIDGRERLLLVLSHYIFNYDGGEMIIKEALHQRYSIVEEGRFPGIEVYVYERLPSLE